MDQSTPSRRMSLRRKRNEDQNGKKYIFANYLIYYSLANFEISYLHELLLDYIMIFPFLGK